MKFKAIVYDTRNGKKREITPRWIALRKGGTPSRISGPNGMQYYEFHLWDDSKPCKYNDFKGSEDDNDN